MSQANSVLANQSGGLFRAALNAALAAIESNHLGDAAPLNAQAGWIWIDSNTPSTTIWTANIYTGSIWMPIYFVDLVANTVRPVNAVPAGCGMDFWGFVAPPGFIFPFGQAISRAAYSILFGVLGTTYGAGDGSTTFTLPDKRDRFSITKGDMGGTNVALTGMGRTLGAKGGSTAHVHNFRTSTMDGANNGIQVDRNLDLQSWNVADLDHQHGNVRGTTDGNASEILPPGIVCNYIISTGGQ